MVTMLTLAVLSTMGDPIRFPHDNFTPISYSVTPAAQDLTRTMTNVQITHIAADMDRYICRQQTLAFLPTLETWLLMRHDIPDHQLLILNTAFAASEGKRTVVYVLRGNPNLIDVPGAVRNQVYEFWARDTTTNVQLRDADTPRTKAVVHLKYIGTPAGEP